MRPERIVATLLAALAAGLVALLVFGPTEGAKAKGDAPKAARDAPTTTAPTTTTRTTTASTTTAPEPEPEETVESEPEPVTTEAEPPPFLPGDGTFPRPVTITLYYESEVDWRTHELQRSVPELRVEARVTAVRGVEGDVHGIECGLARRATYTFLIDPWSGEYVVQETDPVSLTTIDLESGEATTLLAPPHPNVLSLTCAARAKSTFLTLRANGKLVTSLMHEIGGRLDRVALTAWSPEGGQKVVFDGVVVETGGS
jgi:hypothetical protein